MKPPPRGFGLPVDAARVLLAAIAVLMAPLPAAADLKICNLTPSRVGIAIGYKSAEKGDWVTEGWWNVLSHTCETLVPGKLEGQFYYVHAVDYDRGGEWAGKLKMCVDDKTFTIKGVKGCGGRGFEETGFYEVDTGSSGDYTIRLVDPGEDGAKIQ